MLGTSTTDTVIAIPDDQLDGAVEVLARAFADYPVMRYCFADQGANYDWAVREVCRLTCMRWRATGGFLLGRQHAGQLVAVATGSLPPERRPAPADLDQQFERFIVQIGEGAAERLDAFEGLVDRHRPAAPYFFLNVIGVLPEAQGQGHARALLDVVHAQCAAHPTATGVYLDTEVLGNVALYERFGYRIVGQERLDDLDIWCMFRPNDGR
jgi:ribosomal protein S18 acetylase RimI-like enzyme